MPDQAQQPLLEVEGLSVRYHRGGVAVRNVSFSMGEGECVVVAGPNGAGKTSLVRGICGYLGFEGITATGRVRIAGTDVLGRHPRRVARLGVCLVPERKKVFSDLSVEQNLFVLTSASSSDRGELLARAEELFPPLQSLRARRAGLLSGGERQMVALAAALVRQPRLLVLDEPCLGLAPVVTKDLVGFLLGARRATRTTMLIVEQSVRTVVQLADRTLSMRSGGLATTQAGVDAGLAPLLQVAAHTEHG